MSTVVNESVQVVPVRRGRFMHRPVVFWIGAALLILGSIVRSNWATRLDSFTLDEAYHIMAGASYAGTGSFRINPEHPPLTKLWVGEVVLRNGYKLPPFKALNDKREERRFAEENVYLTNDPVAVQQQARWAMFALNGFLLLLFTVMARQTLGPVIALLTLAYLVIDPTVAAHLPVVMTDLPVALTSGAAMLAAIRAFRSWRPTDLLVTAACLGLALAAKHSAVITVIGVGLLGVVMTFVGRESLGRRAGRLGMVAGVLVGAVVVLWGFYGFRYRDSRAEGEFFNRPLATKIDDIQSSLSKTMLHGLADVPLLPASYLWGLADTFRAGVEGRPFPAFAFGQSYLKRAPFYYAPGIWGAKLPLGLLALSLAGLVLLGLGKLPATTRLPLAALGLLFGLFWLALATGSTYGGVRHALSLLPLLAVLGALAGWYAFQQGIWYQIPAVLAAGAALLTAIPVVRPWEYFNELAGGSAGSYHYFNDEGVDLTQRSGELTQYYNRHLKPTGEVPFIWYSMRRAEKQRYNMHWIGENPDQDSSRYQSVHVAGTFFLATADLSPNPYDVDNQMAVFRKARPVTRMGNLLVYRGRFYLPNIRAMWLGSKGYKALFLDKKPDTTSAIRFMAAAMKLYPKSAFMNWELGNLYASRDARAEAIHAFELSRTYCVDPALKPMLTAHIGKLRTADLHRLPPLRNPTTE